jgi:hypothetical protein
MRGRGFLGQDRAGNCCCQKSYQCASHENPRIASFDFYAHYPMVSSTSRQSMASRGDPQYAGQWRVQS